MTAPAAIELPPQALSAREARRWVTERISAYGLEPLCDAVELLTVEVVTNALLHAGTQVRVMVERKGPGVQVDVHDGSLVPPHRQHFSRTATTGRGVGLLDDLADEWGWRPEADGKTVWFRVLHPRETWSGADFMADIDLDGLEPA
ncbi:ATP-binding protein [Jannaschia sp. R86511]|uniref:ATP-binding protein n=1 Tax=Jannaschia sp. R86511 TaxID=3093853 RepID=UPI0036D38D8B